MKLSHDWHLKSKIFSRGSIVSVSLSKLKNNVHTGRYVLKASSRQSILETFVTPSGIMLNTINNVQGEVFQFHFKNNKWHRQEIDLPKGGSIYVLSHDHKTGRTIYSYENFLTPPAVYYAASEYRDPIKFFSTKDGFDSKGLTVRMYEAISKDGTKIPYLWVGPQVLTQHQQTPTLIYAYGGFGLSLSPKYSKEIGRMWLEKGGAYVMAFVRGGGEFGPLWHQAAIKNRHHKSFEDLIAVSNQLIQKGMTSPETLALKGSSNGGLLVGAVAIKRPDLFNAVISEVPLLDMLRYNKLHVGPSWVAEYGDPEESAIHDFWEEYSPYHQIKEGTDYPEFLLMTSTSDDRVHPAHARKFAKRLLDTGHSVYFYESSVGGHNGLSNKSAKAYSLAIQYSYLYLKTGIFKAEMSPNKPKYIW